MEKATPVGGLLAPVGHERPTLIERVLGLLPLPYGWSALIVAALLGPPGSILVAYLETGSLQTSVESYFHGYMPERVWQQVLAVCLWFVFYTILFLVIRHSRTSVLKAKAALASLLPEPTTFDRAFAALSRFLPSLLIGLVIEALFIGDYRLRIGDAPGPYSMVYEAISGPPLYLMAGTAIWVNVRAMWGLFWLGRAPLKLKPFYEDKTMGLRPMAVLSLSLALGNFSLLFIMVLMLLIGPVRIEYMLTVIALLLLGLALFYLPLFSAHRRMKCEKASLQALVKERWKTVLAASLSTGSPVTTDPNVLLTLEATERKVSAVHTWPFDLPILGKLGVMTLTIILGLLTQLFTNLLGL